MNINPKYQYIKILFISKDYMINKIYHKNKRQEILSLVNLNFEKIQIYF